MAPRTLKTSLGKYVAFGVLVRIQIKHQERWRYHTRRANLCHQVRQTLTKMTVMMSRRGWEALLPHRELLQSSVFRVVQHSVLSLAYSNSKIHLE